MAQTKLARTPGSQRHSGIPVVSPRPSRNALPVAASPPRSPPNNKLMRAPSASAVALAATNTPASSSVVAQTTSANTSASGIPSFRSLRSLLPFGPGKLPTSSSPPATKPSFMNFTSGRKSISGERKTSLSYARPSVDGLADRSSPVVSIRPSTTSVDESVKVKPSFQNEPESHVRSELEPTTHSIANTKPLASESTELSTIIEVDTSGISKHIPALDDSRPNESPDLSLPTPPGSDNLASSGDGNRTIDGLDDSVLDLSTSHLQMEVREAISAEGYKSAAKWLEEGALGVVDDAEQSFADDQPVVDDDDREEKNTSFNLGALDRDLAVLLGPNSIPNGHITSSKPFGLTPTASPGSSPLHNGVITSQSSPVRRSFLTPSSSRIPSSSSLTRLCPATSQSTPLHADKELPLLPPAAIYPETPSSDGAVRQGSFDSLGPRPSPPAPPSPASMSRVQWTAPYRKPSSSRVVTPSRHASYSSASGKNSRIRPSLVSAPPNGINIDPATPSPSAASTSLGSTAATRLLSQARASLDDVSRNDSTVTERYRPGLLRSRKRSMSLEAQRVAPGSLSSSHHNRSPYIRPSSSLSNARQTMDWLGPRTAKAFAAAGLIDPNDDASTTTVSRSVSRGGLGSERNARLQQRASSRIAFSEASGSNSSWGRSGSFSHTMTTSEASGTHTESPTFSITRTNFSGASTAPTSVSAVSISPHHQLQATIQTMKERHEVETEALLAALSDSQHTTKVLRLENTELRGQIQRLEDQLEEARMMTLRYQTTHSSMLTQPLSGTLSLETKSKTNSMDDVRRLHPSSSFNSSSNTTFVKTHDRYESTSRVPSTYDLPSKTQLKRISATSSIFPAPPSNMTMLMMEDGMNAGGFSSRSISPPISVPPHSTRVRHAHKRSVSSGGNVSPTTPNFSMTEMTGSPGSLCLRPEHEMHLGDMVSLDLGYSTSPGEEHDT